MRAVNRDLRKVQFYRLTSSLSGPVLSRTETDTGDPIIRVNTPRPAQIPLPIDEQDTVPWLLALPGDVARLHNRKVRFL